MYKHKGIGQVMAAHGLGLPKVKVNQGNQIKEYDISSPKYKYLYNSGKLMGYDKTSDTYIATNPNIYKGLIPPALMTGYLKSKTNEDEKNNSQYLTIKKSN